MMAWQHPTTTPPLCGHCAQTASWHRIRNIENQWWAFCGTEEDGPISDLTNHQAILEREAKGTP